MMDGGGWESYWNSLELAALTGVFGTAIIFVGAYLVEKTPRLRARCATVVHILALLPLAVPGLVLGLGYIFFFNDPANPLRLHLWHAWRSSCSARSRTSIRWRI